MNGAWGPSATGGGGQRKERSPPPSFSSGSLELGAWNVPSREGASHSLPARLVGRAGRTWPGKLVQSFAAESGGGGDPADARLWHVARSVPRPLSAPPTEPWAHTERPVPISLLTEGAGGGSEEEGKERARGELYKGGHRRAASSGASILPPRRQSARSPPPLLSQPPTRLRCPPRISHPRGDRLPVFPPRVTRAHPHLARLPRTWHSLRPVPA